VNCLYRDPSRPTPDSLIPPKGAASASQTPWAYRRLVLVSELSASHLLVMLCDVGKNPYFEIEQLESYIDYLSGNARDLAETIESNFFPALQKVFFYHAYEVRRDVTFEGRAFPFDCIDVLGGRRRVLVYFDFLSASTSVLSRFVLSWGEGATSSNYPALMVIQNRPTESSLEGVLNARSHWVSVLDFEKLKLFARDGFEAQRRREESTVVRMVRDLMERLAVEVARSKVTLDELEWRDVERLMSTVLAGLGIKCLLTRPAKDKGRDLVACDVTADGVAWYNLEIKHWRNRKADAHSVRHCLEVALREGRRGALLVSTGGIGPAALTARTEVYQDFIRLSGSSKIVTTCRHFASRRAGLWTQEVPLRQILFEETL
jgi:hypothetical protein